ncbi:MAG: ThuA domain-containing protein [Phycisphaerae bacterium]
MRRILVGAVLVVVAAALIGKAQAAKSNVPEEAVKKITQAAPEESRVKPAKPRKLLVFNLCRGFRHGAIPYGAKALEIMGQKTGAFEAVLSNDVAMFKPENLAKFDAVCMNNTTGELFNDEALKKSLLDFVRGGKGVIGIHAATDCFYKWPEYGAMMGGYFAGHPWGGGGTWAVKVDDPDHALTQVFGGKGFKVKDEIYQFREPYSREKLRILLTLDMTDKDTAGRKGGRKDNDYAVAWVRSYGQGRVFYGSLGHNNEIFWNPLILQFYLDGIQFALGDLEADTTPSAKVKAGAAAPKADASGWITLFDGKNWMNRDGKAPGAGWVLEDGAMVRKARAGDIWTKARFGDFVLDLEFKTEGNSGIFIRTDKPHDCVQTGIEVQVENTGGRPNPGKHACGAIYDCLGPSRNPVKNREWNHVIITADDNRITVVTNDVQMISMDLNEWTEPRKNPDGSKNKFRTALKNFKREGHIGLQDHGAKVMYRNVKIRPL